MLSHVFFVSSLGFACGVVVGVSLLAACILFMPQPTINLSPKESSGGVENLPLLRSACTAVVACRAAALVGGVALSNINPHSH